MADAAVSFAIENVGNLVIDEGKFLRGVRDQVEEMHIELECMQCFLKDADRRKGESRRVQNWVLEIREATYAVEDLVERFVLKTAMRNRKGVMNRIKKYTFFINYAVELHRVGSRIEDIKAKLSTLRTRLQTYGIRELREGGEEAAAAGRRKRQDYAHVAVDHKVVGLEEKITKLVEHLLDLKQESVVCLHGMGGLGKTTAAKQVFHDKRIREFFECFAWVYISQQCNRSQVWESILSQLSDNKEEVKKMKNDNLPSQICRLQKEKKCLIVVDNIWTSQDWDNLSAAFPYQEEENRSKILLTTRIEDVASVGVFRTNLDVLDDNTSLELLKSTILSLGGSSHPLKENPSMETHFGEMVKECAGLPLAIVVLGGTLAAKQELKDWERVGANIKLYLNREKEEESRVMAVLKSSYEDLPYNLKSCFLYFSQYSKDEEVETTELLQRWIGEGFVASSTREGEETMEEVATEYLNELVSRCMVQVGSRGHTGRVKMCRLHDRMRDFCISKAKEEGFAHSIKLGVGNDGMDLKKASFRRLCIFSGGSSESILSPLQEISPQLRSIRFQFSDESIDVQGKMGASIVRKLKLVRVLELPSIIYTYWCIKGRGQMGNLIHLRFLKLEAPSLPPSIGKLRCLQTLNMEKCSPNTKIPDSLWGMEQLRHLYLPIDSECESSMQHVSNFLNLQTLVNFPPHNFDLQQNMVKFTSVRKLVITQRWGEIIMISRDQKIRFKRLQSLSFKLYTKFTNLEAMTRMSPCLHRLVLNGSIEFPETSIASCAFWPSSLTKLVLMYSKLDESYMRQLATLKSLKALFLCLNAFTEKEMIFLKNDFPQLRHLLVKELGNLEAWTVKEGALPKLVCLEIDNCRRLKSVPDGFQFLEELKELKVKSMAYSFRERLQKGGEDWDRVCHVPSIVFSYCSRAKVTENHIFGFDVKITELVQVLLGDEERDDHCSRVLIHGMGGLGKTTLAKQVYCDRRIRTHFECFTWVCISRQCNYRQVWESILTQLSNNKEAVEFMSDDELSKKLCCLLEERKCLVVIDDIWANGDWKNLSPAFPNLETASRSKILLTSRNEGVIASPGVYRTSLDILDHNSSLELLKNTNLFLEGHSHPKVEAPARSRLWRGEGSNFSSSGGHINPAVTFGLSLARKVSLVRAIMYMVAQSLGVICGVGLVKAFQSAYYDRYGGGANDLANGYNTGIGLATEIIGTIVLVYIVFSATYPKRSARDSHVPCPLRNNDRWEDIAMKLVRGCKGWPMAIVLLGGMLATKQDLEELERVVEKWEQITNPTESSVLELCYEDLSRNLKSCFLYLSQYREDEEIKTTQLIQRWITEGFVASSMEGYETMEEVADEYLTELVSRQMIQVGEKGHTGRIKTCRMHDLLRDFCISKAKEEGFAHSIELGVGNDGADLEKASIRRLCIYCGGKNDKLEGSILSSIVKISPQLSSIWFHIGDEDNLDDNLVKAAVSIVKNLKLVKVLELPSKVWNDWAKSGRGMIGNLQELLTSIGNLRCLQTLNLNFCDRRVKIPNSLWEMEQLRHLYLPLDGICESGKQRVGNFQNLQTLVNFPPLEFNLHQNLVKFKGVRKLVAIRSFEKIGEILRSKEIVFNSLHSLSFRFCVEYIDLEAMTRGSSRLYRLVCGSSVQATATNTSIWPTNLTKLVLSHSKLDETHMRTLAKLRSLKVLFLGNNAFVGKKLVFHENDLPDLNHLKLETLRELEDWIMHEGALPSLVCLEIDNCRKLKSVADGSQILRQLKELKVISMPDSFREMLEQGGEGWDGVSHVPSISFSFCYQEEETTDEIEAE